MKIQLIRYNNEFYLFFNSGVTKKINEKEVRDFLKNYNNNSYNCTDDELINNFNIETASKELMAVVEDNGELRIIYPDLIKEIFPDNYFPYLTSDEYAEKHNRKQSIVLRLCRDGRLDGAMQKNTVWLIPEDTPYPADARVGVRVPSARTNLK